MYKFHMWCINVEMIYDELLLKYTCLTCTCMMTFNLVLCTLSDPEGLTECRRWSIIDVGLYEL